MSNFKTVTVECEKCHVISSVNIPDDHYVKSHLCTACEQYGICDFGLSKPGYFKTAFNIYKANKEKDMVKCNCNMCNFETDFEDEKERIRKAIKDNKDKAEEKLKEKLFKDEQENILQEADRLTGGIKLEEYGEAYESCRRIAWMWEAILGFKVTPEQIPLCMIAFKIIREATNHKRDNIVDIAGYARVLEKVNNME